MRRKTPYRDLDGNDLYEGDYVRHPCGEVGRIEFSLAHENPWRVKYSDGASLWLPNQISDYGGAILVKDD